MERGGNDAAGVVKEGVVKMLTGLQPSGWQHFVETSQGQLLFHFGLDDHPLALLQPRHAKS